jgi:hypothetical protein
MKRPEDIIRYGVVVSDTCRRAADTYDTIVSLPSDSTEASGALIGQSLAEL